MKNPIKRLIPVILSVSLLLGTAGGTVFASAANAETNIIDNSSLLPAYVPDDQVKLDRMGWPEWAKDIIIAEVNVAKATPEGTLAAMDRVLDHYAEMGVNCLWITPVEDMGVDRYHVGYTSYGPHTIDPYITGQLAKGKTYDASKVDYAAGFGEFKKFVDRAHDRNIRIIIDKVTWGLSEHTPLRETHPRFFTGETSKWGGPEFDWNSQELIDWYKEQLEQFVLTTGCDGIRFDLEPTVAGYQIFEELRNDLQEAGRKPLFFSEHINERGYSFAFEQTGSINVVDKIEASAQFFPHVFFDYADLVETVKTGKNLGSEATQAIDVSGQYRYYSYVLSCHDGIEYNDAPLASWSYELLYSSFIPIFYIGEEWNSVKDATAANLYATQVNWELLDKPTNRAYYESVKRLIALRWKYKDIFCAFPNNHRDTNITTVKIKGSEKIDGYARYADDCSKAILVVPNVNEHSSDTVDMTIAVPLKDMVMNGFERYTVTDLLTGKKVVSGTEAQIGSFTAKIPHGTSGLYLVETAGKQALPKKYIEGDAVYEYKTVYEEVLLPAEDNSDTSNDAQNEPDDEQPEDTDPGKIINTVTRTKHISTIPVWLLALLILGGSAVVGGGTVLIVWLTKRHKHS